MLIRHPSFGARFRGSSASLHLGGSPARKSRHAASIFGACRRAGVIEPIISAARRPARLMAARGCYIRGNSRPRDSLLPSSFPTLPPRPSNSRRVTRVAINARGGTRRPRLRSDARIVTAEIVRMPRIPGRFIVRLFCADTWSTAKRHPPPPAASSGWYLSRFIRRGRG